MKQDAIWDDMGGASYLVAHIRQCPNNGKFQLLSRTSEKVLSKKKNMRNCESDQKASRTRGNRKCITRWHSCTCKGWKNLSVDDQGEIKDSLIDFYFECEKDMGDIVGIPSGFTSLDQLTGGFQESDFIVMVPVQVLEKQPSP